MLPSGYEPPLSEEQKREFTEGQEFLEKIVSSFKSDLDRKGSEYPEGSPQHTTYARKKSYLVKAAKELLNPDESTASVWKTIREYES